jgi:hypothetical protein
MAVAVIQPDLLAESWRLNKNGKCSVERPAGEQGALAVHITHRPTQGDAEGRYEKTQKYAQRCRKKIRKHTGRYREGIPKTTGGYRKGIHKHTGGDMENSQNEWGGYCRQMQQKASPDCLFKLYKSSFDDEMENKDHR